MNLVHEQIQPFPHMQHFEPRTSFEVLCERGSRANLPKTNEPNYTRAHATHAPHTRRAHAHLRAHVPAPSRPSTAYPKLARATPVSTTTVKVSGKYSARWCRTPLHAQEQECKGGPRSRGGGAAATTHRVGLGTVLGLPFTDVCVQGCQLRMLLRSIRLRRGSWGQEHANEGAGTCTRTRKQ